MRLLKLLIVLAFVALGVAFSALNPEPGTLDLYFHSITTTSGVMVVAALLLGALAGGTVVTVGVVWPLRQRLGRARRELEIATTPAADGPDSDRPTART